MKYEIKQNCQTGAVLIVALILLLLMTIIGLSAVKGSNLQELMAGNVRDKQVSFQAAEAALRQAEEVVNGAQTPNVSGANVGFFEERAEGSVSSYWTQEYLWYQGGSNYSVLTNINLQNTFQPPRYVVEKLDVAYIPGSDGRAVDVIGVQNAPEILVYRITSRGVGLTENSIVYLQSIYRRQ